jgi:hypothetical protein
MFSLSVRFIVKFWAQPQPKIGLSQHSIFNLDFMVQLNVLWFTKSSTKINLKQIRLYIFQKLNQIPDYGRSFFQFRWHFLFYKKQNVSYLVLSIVFELLSV